MKRELTTKTWGDRTYSTQNGQMLSQLTASGILKPIA